MQQHEQSELQKDYLLSLARQAVISELTHQPVDHDEDLDLILNFVAASFVTLEKAGQLRGCVGTIDAHQSLVNDVKQNALSAAFHDPRFLAVTEDEIADISIEISVLSKPKKLKFTDEQSLLDQIRPAIDGLIIEFELHRATFLPQVWHQVEDKLTFLTLLKQKADIPADIDVTRLKIYRYQVESFRDFE